MMSGDYMRGFQILEAYKSLTPTDLMKVSKEFLNKENRSVVVIKPLKREKQNHERVYIFYPVGSLFAFGPWNPKLYTSKIPLF